MSEDTPVDTEDELAAELALVSGTTTGTTLVYDEKDDEHFTNYTCIILFSICFIESY